MQSFSSILLLSAVVAAVSAAGPFDSPKVGAGKSCGGGYPGAPVCKKPYVCRYPLVPEGMTGVSGTCVHPNAPILRKVVGENEPCGTRAPFPVCSEGLFCNTSNTLAKMLYEDQKPEEAGTCQVAEE